MTAIVQASSGRRSRAAPAAPVVAVTALVSLIALAGLPFLSQAPNRLVAGEPLGLVTAVGIAPALAALAIVAALVASAWLPERPAFPVAAVLAASAFLLILVLAGGAAAALNAGKPPFARVAFGGGAWIALIGIGLALADALPRLRWRLSLAIAAAAVLGAAIAAYSGILNELSLVEEFLARRDSFWPHVGQHLLIATAGLVPAVILGVPLALLARWQPALRASLDGVLGTIQVIPAIALFALLMTPLTALASALPWLRALGVSGVGATPAVIGLLLYLLLPIVRATGAGLASVDPRVVDAARGMGYRPLHRILAVEMPLALPALRAGLRIASIQAIGLATLAALIGGGGLGDYVFQGMGQFAIDLVLLGVIPIALLTGLVDSLFRLLEARHSFRGGPAGGPIP